MHYKYHQLQSDTQYKIKTNAGVKIVQQWRETKLLTRKKRSTDIKQHNDKFRFSSKEDR